MYLSRGYIVDINGQILWRDVFHIQDEALKSAYHQLPLVGFIIESSAAVGIQVGLA